MARIHLTYANVMATVAVFIALGGGAYAVTVAKKNSVVSKSIKNGQVKTKDLAKNAVNGAKVTDNSLSGNDINEATLGQIASASHADSATNADHASSADTATTADNATHATTAESALPSGPAGGALAGSYPNPQLAPPEAVHTMTLGASWVPYSIETAPGYWKDAFGVVHLEGEIKNGLVGGGEIFTTLPAGYHPDSSVTTFYGVLTSNGNTTITPGEVDIASGGGIQVFVGDNHMVSLNGITFRAAN